MTRRRWIADEVSGKFAALTGSHAEHLSRVLRAHVGQEFDIAAGDKVHRGRITEIEKDRVVFELREELSTAMVPKLDLLLAIFKFDRMEWAIEKCTELGVARITPVVTRRTDPHLASAALKRRERWQRIAREAAEQSRQSAPPEVAEPVKLKDVLNQLASGRIVLAESENQLTLKSALEDIGAGASSQGIVLAVGPEGGWTADELSQFSQAGWIAASLGATILRAETAAIAAAAIVLAEFGA